MTTRILQFSTVPISRREEAIMTILINGEKYGLEIRDEFRKRTKQDLPIGSLYTTLARMEYKRLIKRVANPTLVQRNDYKKQFFSLTEIGRQELDRLVMAMQELRNNN